MKIIGHRGAKGLAPENTLAGLEKALEHHADGIELDIRVTKDNIAVLLHDELASDAAGNKLRVRDHAYQELKAHKPDMPTLEEAITLVARKVPMAIELKPGEPTAPVIKVIRQFLTKGWQPADLAFISFDYRLLKELHAAFPDHLIIVDEMWSSIRATWRARRLGTKHISLYRPVLWTGFIKAVAKRGYHLYTFPLNDLAHAKRWEKAGLYAVITDYPDRFEK